MSKSLENALAAGAWSVSAVMFDLNAIHDDEGRPISERRADAAARVGVEMEMRKCPFPGIRHDRWMNVSALTQITHYYNDVLAEIAAFRRHTRADNATWDDILACIVDLLAGPAIYLLRQRSPRGPVPARVAVGHKLAAGMFGVLRGLHERLALGADIPVTVESFMELIDETDALVGATYEACAGSLAMIRKASTVLMEGSSELDYELDPLRVDIAACLAFQVRLGIFWRLYDRIHLWELMRGEFRAHLAPCNNFLERKIDTAANELDAVAPPRPNNDALPHALDAQIRHQLVEALNDSIDAGTREEDLRTATELLTEPGSPIRYNGDPALFALSVANYLYTYRLFEAELSKTERELRGHLDYPLDTPIRLGAGVFPPPQAMPWYELILGRRLGEDGRLTGKNTKTKV